MFLVGTVLGVILTGISMVVLMPKLMIVTHQSRYATIDETTEALKNSIEQSGWNCLAIRNMNKSAEKHGVHMDRQVRLVELCKAPYAEDILVTNPEVSTLMPCAWGVYEGDDGKVYISGMNMGLMGKMFGGNIAKVMGGFVSKDEKKMLDAVVRK